MRVSAEGPVTLPIDGTLRCTKKSAVCDVSSTSTPSAGWSAVRKSPASVVFARTASLEKRFPSHETPRPKIASPSSLSGNSATSELSGSAGFDVTAAK